MAADFKDLPAPPPRADGSDKEAFMVKLAQSDRKTPHWKYDPSRPQLELYMNGQLKYIFPLLQNREWTSSILKVIDEAWATPQIVWALIHALSHLCDPGRSTFMKGIWE